VFYASVPCQVLWHFVDASSAPVGRVANRIATLLQGKHKPIFHPAADCGDFVVVKNAGKLVLTGRKAEDKEYIRHTGYPDGLRITNVKTFLAKNPAEIIKRAVNGMLPKNRLRVQRMERLKIFSDNSPQTVDANRYTDYRK
jgi:large subunit ribosomal protein L13